MVDWFEFVFELASKRLKRHQPERMEKYRERQGRANRKQHHKLTKPSARHDMQRERAPDATQRLVPSRSARRSRARNRLRPGAKIDGGGGLFLTLPLPSHHSITSSARARRVGGTLGPSLPAVF